MHFQILGTAAGGGLPQWNCACTGCSYARANSRYRRAHACAAFSADGESWYLLNAPPDIAAQIESVPVLHPGPGIRQTRIKGVILTDAELDHTIGLLVLREQSSLQVFCTQTVQHALATDFPVQSILSSYASISWQLLHPGLPLKIDNGLVTIHPFVAGRKRPRYVKTESIHNEWVLGLRIVDNTTMQSIVYAPAVEHFAEELNSAIRASKTIFIDGTFCTDDELARLQVSNRSASECGHLPLIGRGGLIEYLGESGSDRRIYLVHINNTNPLVGPEPPMDQLPEWMAIAAEGMVLEE